MASRKERPEHPMVGWYDPGQLIRTGTDVLLSTIFGKHADRRVLQAIGDAGGLRELHYYEAVASDGDDFWFDFVSDVGDGFNSTYSVAYHLTQDSLDLTTRDDTHQVKDVKRGGLLIFGGDEVYPVASEIEYKERLVYPYETAFPEPTEKEIRENPTAVRPAVFAIPGNHDWYDSLIEFTGIFCRGRDFAGWRTYQNRSYFALKLPHGWWVFGTDMQLASNLDVQQENYFKAVVQNHFEEGDRVILCNAEPWWITREMYAEQDPNYKNPRMGFFEGHILRDRLAIHIAGDRHYYRRHEETMENSKPVDPNDPSKRQKIVAGGGGAFLHPTHLEGVETIGDRHVYALRTSYPSESTSASLTKGNIRFAIINHKFGLIPGLLYLLTAQAFASADLGRFGLVDWWSAIKATAQTLVYEPIATLFVALIYTGFYFFTDTHSRRLRYFAGPIHATLNLLTAFAVGWFVAYNTTGLPGGIRFLVSAAAMYAAGHILSSILMGVYLWVMLNVFGVHHNEAFSSLKLEDYKNFLRMKIDSNGDLSIFPIGIERVYKQWRDGETRKDERRLEPVSPDSEDSQPFLIEPPIRYAKPPVAKKPEKARKPELAGNIVVRGVNK